MMLHSEMFRPALAHTGIWTSYTMSSEASSSGNETGAGWGCHGLWLMLHFFGRYLKPTRRAILKDPLASSKRPYCHTRELQ